MGCEGPRKATGDVTARKPCRHHRHIPWRQQAIATGSAATRGGVRVYAIDAETEDPSAWTWTEYSSPRALRHAERHIHPACMQWGKHAAVNHLLLVGFTPEDQVEDQKMSSTGDLCLWDANTGHLQKLPSRNTFDCVWQIGSARFATGCVADSQANRGIRTYFRL